MPRKPIRRTKIVATLGPAWETPAQMTALLDAGVNVVRINASHGTPVIRARWIHQLRSLLVGRRDAAAVDLMEKHLDHLLADLRLEDSGSGTIDLRSVFAGSAGEHLA